MRKLTLLIAALFLSSCATAWKVESVQFQPVQTLAAIDSQPSANVLVANRKVGKTPLEVPLNYEKEVRLERRHVSYWRTEPGWSLFVTLISLGVYLPFSLIPADTESRFIETGVFRGNEFLVVFEDDLGNPLGQDLIVAKGEPKLSLNRNLGGKYE